MVGQPDRVTEDAPGRSALAWAMTAAHDRVMGIDMDVPHHRTGLPAWTADPWFDRTAIVETWNVPGAPHTGGLATGTEG